MEAGGVGLTADHARAVHFANEVAELRHYGPLIAVVGGLPVLAPGVRSVTDSLPGSGLCEGQPSWDLSGSGHSPTVSSLAFLV